MSLTEAIEFARRYPTVVTNFDDPATGLQLTVFKDTAGDLPGNLTIAFRGTTIPEDLAAGVEIVGAGAAYSQIVAMANWWARDSAPQGQIVQQFQLVNYALDVVPAGVVVLRSDSMQSLVLEAGLPVAATGTLTAALTSDADGRVDLTGHSLGGHLAMAFSGLFASRTGQVTVFNAPGFKSSTANHDFFTKLGGSIPTGSISTGSISNVAADEALVGDSPFNFIAGMYSRPGVSLDIAIEKQTNSDEPNPFTPALNHSMVALVDTLAIYKLLADLAPATGDNAFTADAYKRILNQAVQGTAAGYERIVDVLEKLFLNDSKLLATGNNYREELYKAIQELTKADSAYDAKKGRLKIEAVTGAADVFAVNAQANDQKGLAWRYALKELDPFVVLDESGTGVYARFQSSGTNAGELDLYNPSDRTGTLTAQWLEDRAALLQRKLDIAAKDEINDIDKPLNLNNTTKTWAADNLYFEDRTTGYIVNQGANGGQRAHDPYIIFGSNRADAILGSIRADRLYGGSSTDYLIGKGGADYFEGGKGLDIYEYDSARAVLFGTSPDGDDTVLDVDGKGVLRYLYKDASGNQQSTVIGGVAIKGDDGKWRTVDGQFVFEAMGADLKATFASGLDGSITIKNYKDGDLSIRLQETRVDPRTGAEILGDYERDPSPVTRDTFGNLEISGPEVLNQADILFGGRPDAGIPVDPNAPGEKFLSGGGNDIILSDRPRGEADNGLGNADWIIAGAGRDWIEAGAGNDLIEAGADADIVDGGTGDDEIYADSKVTLSEAIRRGNEDAPTNQAGDFLSGGAGKDWIIGGAGDDVLLGGGGEDLIIGGAGDDTIRGDLGQAANSLGWIVTRTETEENGKRHYRVTFSDTYVNDTSAGAADVIYGGGGKDWIFGGGGDDFIDGGADNDVLFGEAGSDILIGGTGNDVLIGDGQEMADGADGADYLDGGDGEDQLFGDGGNDILIGGRGNDILIGGAGRDIYVFNKGDGEDTVVDVPEDSGTADASVLVLGDGFSKGDIKFRTGSLLVDLGPVDPSDPNSSHDMIHFEGFDQYDPRATPLLSEIRFADGTSMSYEDILAQGFDIDGTEGDDDGHDTDHPILSGTGVTDRIRGFGGNDVLLGAGGDDVLDGGSGNDHLQGGDGNDTLLGGEGDDVLLGENGDDVLDGGPGADTMAGGAGNDTYIADFADTIIDTEGSNAIQFAAGVALDTLRAQNLAIDGENYLLLYQDGATQTIPGIPDGLKIKGDLDQLNFSFASADGTVLTQQQFLGTAFTQDLFVTGTNDDDVLTGYAGNDTLSGYSGNDTLTGGRGDDSLIGYDGSDTYVFNSGDGQDTIQENGLLAIGIPDTEGIDAIRFGAGIAAADVTLTRQADGNLVIAYGSSDRVTVTGQYINIINSIERIEFDDGTVIDAAALASLPIAPVTGTANDDVLSGTTADDTLLGLAGNDLLDGGPTEHIPGLPTGNDRLEGGAGADRYAMYVGMGQDTLVDASPTADETSTLALDAGLVFDNLKSTRDGNDLVVGLRGTPDSARIQGYYDAAAAPQHWQIGLADGTTLPIDDLINRVDPYADNIALQAREDYRQGVMAGWNAQSKPLTLPTLAYVFSSWSQTTTTYYYNRAFPPQVEVLPQVDYNVLYDYWVQQGNSYIPVSSYQTQITPVTANHQSDAADIFAGNIPAFSSQSYRYGVSLGGRVGVAHSSSLTTVTVAASADLFNTTVSYTSSSLRNIGLTLNPVTNYDYYFNLTAINEQRVIEEINAGDSNNNIYAALGANHVALVDAGAGDDFVSVDGNDFVYANGGDDTVNGGYLVFGGDGNDSLLNGTNLYGGAGNDFLIGGQVMSGGEGDDSMVGISGLTQYLIDPTEAGEDYIADNGGIERANFEYWYYQSMGIPNIDESWEFGGRYSVIGQTGNRLLELNAQGGVPDPYYNDDIFAGSEWPSPVYDSLNALRAELALYGLPYRGQDIRYIQPLPPAPWIAANAYTELEPLYAVGLIERDIVVFGPGVNPEEVTVTRNADEITLSWGQGKLLHAALAQPGDRIGTGIEQFSFANGETWSIREALNRNIVGTPTGGDDVIYFTENADIAYGLDGSDALYTFDGNDILNGGTGNDVLAGGLGSDTYIFDLGSGQDVIAEFDSRPGDVDTIAFGAGITPESIRTQRVDDDLVVLIDGTQDQLTISQWFTGSDYRIERLTFADGTRWNGAVLEDLVTAGPISGNADDNVLDGTSGNDIMLGLGGNDTLYGYEGNDTLDGGPGDDYLDGGAGDDTYIFGLGSGIDTITDESGNDTIAFGAGITPDMLTLGLGSLLINVGTGGDAIHIEGFSPYDVYGSQVIENFTFADGTALTYEELIARGIHIDGTEGDDYLYGTNGPDILDGGAGNDHIYGDAGNDTLIFGRGYGQDIFEDYDETPGNVDTLKFAADITPGDVLVSGDNGDLVLGIAGTNDQVVLQNWFWDEESKIEQVAFADGTVWDVAALEAMVPMAEATENADYLFGTSGDDVIDGLGGDDQIAGGHGNDLLIGGTGNDYLVGGGGNDILLGGGGEDDLEDWNGNNYFDGGSDNDFILTDDGASFIIGGLGDDWIEGYSAGNVVAFNSGDGHDTIYAAAPMTLSLGGGIHAADFVLSRDGIDLVLEVSATDSIRFTPESVQNPDAWPQITLQIIDGAVTTYDLNEIINQYNDLQANDPALTSWQIGDALAAVQLDSSTEFALGGNLAYRYATAGSNDSLTPDAIRAILADPVFGAAPQPFEAISATNHAPQIGAPIDAVAATQDAPFVFTLPAGTFIDPDASDALTLSATLADGTALPDWLAFDGATFSGTPANENVGTLQVRVTATDNSGAQVFNEFALDVTNTNDAPQVAGAITDQSTLEDAPFTFSVPAGTFTDVDMGDALTLSATLADGTALPAWLLFDPATQAFTGTPGNADVGTLNVAVTATDTAHASATDTFELTVVNVNDAPILIKSIDNHSVADGDLFDFQIPPDTFTDIDAGDSLSYGAALASGAPLPAWLAFDSTTRSFNGTPSETDIGTLDLSVTATDTSGVSASGNFDLTVTVAPDTTYTGTSGDDWLYGRSGNDTLNGLAGNDVLFGNSGNDRLAGGPGDDLLLGGTGNDTYVYQMGDGLDTIADAAGVNTVEFGAGLTLDNVAARMSTDNTTVRVRVLDANGSEQANQGLDVAMDAAGGSAIEWFTFATGAPATIDDLLIRKEVHTGTRRNDVMRTGRNDDTVYAGFGNDTIYAGTGNDVIYGDRGRDILYGEGGNDVLIGGRGKDQLYGGYGDDVLEGGRGSDILDGGAGYNTYVFERNFGDDRILRGSGSGALRFGDGISARDLSFKRRNNDLVVKVKGEGRIRIEGWFDANASHQVAGAEFADGTVIDADQFVANGYDTERERDEDDDDDGNAGHHGDGSGSPPPQADSHHDDHHDTHARKDSEDHGKNSAPANDAWFEKVVGKWDARYAHGAKQNADREDARGVSSHSAQPRDPWQRMHDKLSAHLAHGEGEDDNGGADLAALKPGSAHGPSFAQFGTIGYGGIGVKDSGAADLRPFAGLREGLARIA